MKNLTLQELEILLEDCQKLSKRYRLSDEYLQEHTNATPRSSHNISTLDGVVVCGGEFSYGIPMVDVDVLVAVLIELIVGKSK